jgi:hypothetical protein
MGRKAKSDIGTLKWTMELHALHNLGLSQWGSILFCPLENEFRDYHVLR